MPENIPGVVSESGILPTTPATLEEIKRRRAIAAALASRQRPFPTTIGQGLTSMGEAFGDVMAEKRLTAQEAELQKRSAGAFAGSPAAAAPTAGAVPAVAAPPPVSIVPPRTAPAATAPIPPVARVTTLPAAVDPREAIARAIVARDGMAGPTEPQPAREVASPDPTQAGEQPPQALQTATASELPSPTAGGDDNSIWAARMGAIEGIESRGHRDPYRAVGAPTKYGRGIGRYQVVEANIAPWTQAALGQALTPEQFRASPQAQDAVFKHRFGQYVAQFGEEGAARAWFGGPGNVAKGGLTDLHKRLSIADYGKSYMEGLNASADPTRLAYASTGTATDAPPVGARGGMAVPPLAEENPVTPSDITPAPTRVADVRAEARGVVPGAVPSLPPSRGAAPEEYRPPKPTPPEPLRRLPETDLERRIRETLIINPEYRPALLAAEQAAAERKRFEDSEKIRYTADVQRFEVERKEEQAWLAGEEDRREKRKQRQETEQLRLAYGNLPKPAVDVLEESKKTAQISAGALEAVQDARIAMNNGALFGFGAEARLQANRALAYTGSKEAARVVAATQTFQSNMGPIIQQILKGIAGKDVSTKELEFVRGIAGGDIALDKEAAERILNINEKMARSTLQGHKDTVETILKGQPETAHPVLRRAYEIREPRPGEPMVSGKPDEASSAAKPIEEGRTATGSRGEKWIRRGGKWEPM